MKPAAVVLPKHDDAWPVGKYGPIWPKTPACYGFTIVANVKPGHAETIRGYGHVKMRHLKQAEKQRAELLAKFNAPVEQRARAA